MEKKTSGGDQLAPIFNLSLGDVNSSGNGAVHVVPQQIINQYYPSGDTDSELSSKDKLEYVCSKCKSEFSGIWEHFKCKECSGIFYCPDCYNFSDHPHKVIRQGENFKGEKSLHNAAKLGRSLDVIYHVEKAACGDETKEKALHLACEKGHRDIVQYLISQRVDVNWKCENEMTAIDFASIYGHSDIVEILLQNGATLNGGPHYHEDRNVKDSEFQEMEKNKEDKSKEKREEESDDEIEEDFKDFLLQKRGHGPLHVTRRFNRENESDVPFCRSLLSLTDGNARLNIGPGVRSTLNFYREAGIIQPHEDCVQFDGDVFSLRGPRH